MKYGEDNPPSSTFAYPNSTLAIDGLGYDNKCMADNDPRLPLRNPKIFNSPLWDNLDD